MKENTQMKKPFIHHSAQEIRNYNYTKTPLYPLPTFLPSPTYLPSLPRGICYPEFGGYHSRKHLLNLNLVQGPRTDYYIVLPSFYILYISSKTHFFAYSDLMHSIFVPLFAASNAN